MSKAEDILRQQKEEQIVTKMAEESARIAKVKLEEYEAKVKQQAIDAGFDPADPIKGWHNAVEAFNKEKDEFDLTRSKFTNDADTWIADYTTRLKALSEAEQKFKDSMVTRHAQLKSLDDSISTKQHELTSKTLELRDKQNALQTIANETTTKIHELEDVEARLKAALNKCKKLVFEANERRNYYDGLALAEYDEALASTWDRFYRWVKSLFADLSL